MPKGVRVTAMAVIAKLLPFADMAVRRFLPTR